MTISYQSATSTANFVNSIGVNTHIDFSNSPYTNLSQVENAILYLGIKNLRDSPENTSDVGSGGTWQKVAAATGAKFDAYIPEGSVSQMQTSLTYMSSLAKQGILNFIEGGNEEDDSYAASLGNSLSATASFQKQVYATGHAAGVPVINMSFGAGWGSSSTGDYGKVGNLAAYADYANAHTYPGSGNTPGSTIATLASDAQLAANGKPVITTEIGYYTTGSTTDSTAVSQTEQAKYLLDALLDGYQQGDPKTYLYELFNDQSNSSTPEYNFGLFNANGTAKPAATAIHNLTTLLADSGSSSFTPGTLGYSLTGLQSNDHSLLLEKSNGTYWLALWDEARLSGPSSPGQISVANHNVTLTLASAAGTVEVFDPLTGTTAVQTASNTSSVTVSLPDHPVLVEIIPGSSSSSGGSTGSSGGSGGSTGGSTGSSGGSSGGTSGSGGTLSPQDLAITLPSAPSLSHGAVTALPGVTIDDAWAANHSGTMALNLTSGSGTLEISNGSTTLSGHSLHLTGSLSQLDADLATLHYQATSLVGVDTVSVNVWNQAGVSATHSLTIHVV